MIYDVNCPRCRVKMEIYFIENRKNMDHNDWLKQVIEFDLEVDKIIYDRLA